MKKRILSLVLVVAMVATLFAGLTLTASAAGTKTSSIAAGDQVVIVCENANKEMTSISTTSTKYGIGGTIGANTLVFDVVAGSETGSFAFKNGSNYLRWNSGNSVDTAGTAVAKNTSWIVTFDASGNALLKNANDTTRELWWNNGSPRFACYTGKTADSTYYATQLYKIGGTTPPASEETTAPSSEDPTPSSEEPVPSGDGKYVKVTSAPADGQYLIVCEDQNVAFNGALTNLDAVSNTVAVTISNGEIAASADLAAAEFTFTAADGSFLSKSGKYIGNSADSNALSTSTSALTNTVSISGGDASIKAAGGSYLRYNATSGQTRFRYYKSGTYTAQKAIQLYMWVAGTVDPTEPSSEPTEPSVEPTEPTEPIVPSGDGYTLVTDVSVLTAGDKLLLVGIKDGSYYALAPYVSGNNCKCNAVPAPVSNVITTDAAALTLGGAAGAWTLFDGTYYLYAAGGTASNNYLKGAANADNDNAKWTIAISGGVPTIKTVDSTVARHTIRFNTNGANDPLFGCYASGQTDYAIYRKAAVVIECDHANATDVAATEPTCTDAGFTAGRFCPDCEQWLSGHETIAALGHDYVVDHTTAPTCTEAGLDTYTCSRCTDSYTKDVPATGHNYENGVCTVCSAEEPTADEFGLVNAIADGDEVIIYNPENGVAIKNGNFGGDWYMETAAVTPADGIISTYDTSIVWTVTYDDESDKYIFENGVNAIVAWLSGNYFEVNNDPSRQGADAAWTLTVHDVDDHTYAFSSALKSGTCLEVYSKNINGESQLAVTGYTYAASDANFGFQFYVKGAEVAHDHVWDEGTETTAATCTEAGVMTYACTVDGCDETRTEAIPALGHIDENEDGTCDRCSIALETYTLSTAAPTAGNDYIIVAESNGKYYALDNTENGNGQVLTCTEVFPSNGTLVCSGDYAFSAVTAKDSASTPNEGVAFLQLGSETQYLHLNSGKIRVASQATNGVFEFAPGTATDTFTMFALQNGMGLSFNGTKFVSAANTMSDLYFYTKESAVPHVCEFVWDGNVGADGFHGTACECGETSTEACTFENGFCTVCGAAEPVVEAGTYALVSDASALSDGSVIILGSAAKGYANGAFDTKYLTAVAATFEDGYVTSSDVAEITLEAATDGWYLKLDNKYINTTAAKALTLGDDASTVWTIDIADDAATISAGEELGRFLFNANNGQERFLNYTSATNASMLLPEIYVKDGTIVVCEHEDATLTGAVAATCTEAGYTGDLVCDNCGRIVEAGEVIPALGHIDENEDLICDRCGNDMPQPLELEGDFYIAAIRSSGNYWYMKGELTTTSTKRFVATDTGLTELPAEITTPDAAYIWTIGQDGDGNYTLYNAAAGKYASWTSGNSGALADVALPLVIEEVDGGVAMYYVTGGEKDRYLSLNEASPNDYFAFYEHTQIDTLVLIPVNGEVCEHEETTLTGAVAATCTEAGYTGDLVCDDCGAVVTAGEAIPALGHIDENEDLICDRCDADLTPVVPVAGDYVKVTTAPADWSGRYLLVYEVPETTTAYVFNGLDAGYDFVEAEIVDDSIAIADGMAIVEIAAMDGGYSLKVIGGTNDGKFISGTSGQNKLNFKDEAQLNTIAISDGSAVITSNTSVLRFNKVVNDTSMRFRYYKAASYADQQPVQLYKFVGEIEECDHIWVDPDLTDENLYMAPTCTEDGIKYQVCSECGAIAETGIIIEALGHDRVEDAAVEATCTATGLTAGYHCSRCDDDTLAQEVIPALGHDYIYTNNGDDHTVTCSRCDYSATEAHTFVEGTCVCGATETVAPTPAPTLKFALKSLNMQSYLGLQLVMTSKVYNAYDRVWIEAYETKYDSTNHVDLAPAQVDYSFGYEGTYPYYELRLDSVAMTDVLDITLYAEKDGVTYIGEHLENYTVRQLAVAKVANIGANPSDAEAKNLRLVADLLTYGAKAQILFDYRTNDLATDTVSDKIMSYATPLSALDGTVTTTGTANGVTVAKYALNLASVIEQQIIYRFPSGTNDSNISNYEARITVEGKDEPVIIDGSEFGYAGVARYYYVSYSGLGTNEMSKTVTFSIWNKTTGQQVSVTSIAGINAMAGYKYNESGAAQAVKDASAACVNYGISSKAVFG